MRRRIYVETSIPSFYFEVRAEPEMVARRQWTKQWWSHAHGRDELVTSEAVLNELSRGIRSAMLFISRSRPTTAAISSQRGTAATSQTRTSSTTFAESMASSAYLYRRSSHRSSY